MKEPGTSLCGVARNPLRSLCLGPLVGAALTKKTQTLKDQVTTVSAASTFPRLVYFFVIIATVRFSALATLAVMAATCQAYSKSCLTKNCTNSCDPGPATCLPGQQACKVSTGTRDTNTLSGCGRNGPAYIFQTTLFWECVRFSSSRLDM